MNKIETIRKLKKNLYLNNHNVLPGMGVFLAQLTVALASRKSMSEWEQLTLGGSRMHTNNLIMTLCLNQPPVNGWCQHLLGTPERVIISTVHVRGIEFRTEQQRLLMFFCHLGSYPANLRTVTRKILHAPQSPFNNRFSSTFGDLLYPWPERDKALALTPSLVRSEKRQCSLATGRRKASSSNVSISMPGEL